MVGGRIAQGLRTAWQRLVRDRRGSTLPLIAASLLPMMGALGGAVDFARLYIVRTQMQAAVDAAALAGGNAYDNTSDASPSGRRMQVIDHYRDNFPDAYMGVQTKAGASPIGGTRTLAEPVFELANGISRTTVRASGTVPMTFMGILGVTSRDVGAVAQVEYQPHPLEVQVVLDNTGSMNDQIGGVSKMNALKAAMHSFINVLYQGGTTNTNLALGINNYTITTNVGAILKAAGVEVESMPGYTDAGWDTGNAMGWKGCVADDETINNMSSDLTVKEANAYDIWPSLPGQMPTKDSPHYMKAIKPYLYPPSYFPTTAAWNPATVPYDDKYFVGSGSGNMFPSAADLPAVANTTLYKRFFYRNYIMLNDGAANIANDVIVSRDANGNDTYYDPTAADAFNPLTGVGRDFYVRADKIPNKAAYKTAVHYDITKYSVSPPSPNYQCPEAGLPIVYNVPRKTYDDFVDQKVWPVSPANGTMHHIGFIWGFRLLSQTKIFARTPPAGAAAPRRALVFMTDGKTELSLGAAGQWDKTYTAYGTPMDGVINPVPAAGVNPGTAFRNAVDLRFAKACAIANSTVFGDSGKGPMIFVVAINQGSDIDSASQTRLRNCGTSGYWLTTSSDQLANAFSQIARTLIDVHLTK